MSEMTVGEATATLTEFAVRDYLRTVPGVLARVSNDTRRIDLDYSGTGTFLVLYRSGGGPYRGLPMDQAVLTLHCYGSTRHAAALLEAQAVLALQALSNTPLNDTVFAYGASILARGQWLPDAGAARYVVTANVRTRARQ